MPAILRRLLGQGLTLLFERENHMLVNKKIKKHMVLLLFVLPALVFYLTFMLAPAFGGIWYSFTNWNGLNRTYRFIGLSNYAEAIFEDPNFKHSILFTLKYVVCIVILQNAIALFLAVLIESRRKSKVLFRTVYFMPNILSMIIAGYMWLFIFTKVTAYLANLTPLFSFLNQSWIGDTNYSFISILVVSLWGGVGYQMVIYIAAIQSVPQNLKESAVIDGATAFQAFRYVTLPMITHALTIGIFLTLNSSIKVFDIVFSLTGGGPGWDTQAISLNIFEEAYKMHNRYGYASAKAIILFMIVFIITLVQLYVMKKKEIEA